LFNSLMKQDVPKSLFHFDLSRCPPEMDFCFGGESEAVLISKAF